MELKNTYDAMEIFAEEQVDEMKKKLSWTQNLKNSITYKISEIDGNLLLQFHMPYYSVFVNDGRRKGAKQPPIKPILEWARAKNLPTFKTNSGKSISEKSRAFLIARSISKKGIPAKPFMHIPSDNRSRLGELIGAGFATDTAIELQMVFDDTNMF